MAKEYETTIFVKPTAKGRARMSIIGGHARAYTPASTRNAEADIKAAIRQQVTEIERFEAGIPLALDAVFYREKPKSTPKKVFMPVSKPDADNYCKLLLDALNGYLFADDNQIVTLRIKKRFTTGQPCIYLKIKEEVE